MSSDKPDQPPDATPPGREPPVAETGTERWLGTLRHLTGTWEGTGLHVGFWENETDDQPTRARAHATRETVSFGQLAIPPGESDTGEFPCVYYLRRANDRQNARRVHAESGTWLPAAEQTGQPDPFEILCLTRTACGEPTACLGTCRVRAGKPVPPALAIKPRRDLKNPDRGPALKGLADMATPPGISRTEAENPDTLLHQHLAAITVTRSIELSVSSAAADAMADALRSSGLAVKPANTRRVELDLMLLLTAGATAGYDQLLLSRNFTRELDGVRWPQASVAILQRVDAPST